MAESPQMRRSVSGVIRIVVPASAVQNLAMLQESITKVAEAIGHPNCFSGVDCHYLQERDFVINGRLDVVSAPPSAAGPDSIPSRTARGVTITLPTAVSFDLRQVHAVTAKIAREIGCSECHSGFDWRFQQELNFVIDQNLNVHGTGGL